MARNVKGYVRIINQQAAALVGALSLSLLPVGAGAQFRMPGMPPYQQSQFVRPVAPTPGTLGTLPMFRPGQTSPSMGASGGLNRPVLPGMGGFVGGGLGGSPLNRNDVNFNTLFGHGPYGLNGIEAPFTPLPFRGAMPQGNDLFPPGYFSQTPAIMPQTRHYGARASQPIVPDSTSYRRPLPAPGAPVQWYDNGHRLHHLAGAGWDIYFPHGVAYYSGYCPGYADGLTVLSPYYYYGTFPAYIGATTAYDQPPPYAFVPLPTYTPDGAYNGYQPEDVDNYYLNQKPQPDASPSTPQDNGQGTYRIGEAPSRAGTTVKDTLLDSAVADLNAAWKNGDIQSLSKHIRRDARIAVYLRGKYQYSLDSSDYLDMTRDAFRSTKTVSYVLDSVQRKEKGIYTVSGRHTYTDQAGKNHTVLVNYVLEKVDDEYFVSQVGTSPEKLEE